jgi:hypothetical protein
MYIGIMLFECIFVPEPSITVFAQVVDGILMLAETLIRHKVPVAEATVERNGSHDCKRTD